MGKYSGVPKPKQGDKDEVPSGLGFATSDELGGSLDPGARDPIARKAGLPPITEKGTFNMCNAKEDEADPY